MRVGLLLVLSLLGACRASPAPRHPPSVLVPEALPPNLSVEGRTIDYRVYGHGPETVLYLATIHGDEAAGTPLLEAFVERLNTRPEWLEGNRAVVVPLVNPDGAGQRSRANARGVDLNRNFPASNWRASRKHGDEPLSEPESRFLAGLIEALAPARILSFHQAADLIDYDGPGGGLAHHLAAFSPLEVRRMGARPGSLGSYAGVDLGLAVVTIELPRAADALDRDSAWDLYGSLLVEALRYDTAQAGTR